MKSIPIIVFTSLFAGNAYAETFWCNTTLLNKEDPYRICGVNSNAVCNERFGLSSYSSEGYKYPGYGECLDEVKQCREAVRQNNAKIEENNEIYRKCKMAYPDKVRRVETPAKVPYPVKAPTQGQVQIPRNVPVPQAKPKIELKEEPVEYYKETSEKLARIRKEMDAYNKKMNSREIKTYVAPQVKPNNSSGRYTKQQCSDLSTTINEMDWIRESKEAKYREFDRHCNYNWRH